MPNPDARLRQLRIKHGFKTMKAASDFFGWPFDAYKSHENGVRPLSKKAAARYAKGYRVTAGWLLFGESSQKIETNFHNQTSLAIRSIPRLTWDIVKNTPDLNQAIEEATQFYVASGAEWFGPLAFALPIEDESMLNTDTRSDISFRPGDEILLDPEKPVAPGHFILARIFARSEPIFRQYRETGYDKQGRKIVTLHALNQNWADEEIVLGSTGEIIARLIRHSRDYS